VEDEEEANYLDQELIGKVAEFHSVGSTTGFLAEDSGEVFEEKRSLLVVADVYSWIVCFQKEEQHREVAEWEL
jgi:hypothetical protein